MLKMTERFKWKSVARRTGARTIHAAAHSGSPPGLIEGSTSGRSRDFAAEDCPGFYYQPPASRL